jgi:hypothetical protein
MRIAAGSRSLTGRLHGNGRTIECVVVVRNDDDTIGAIETVTPPPDGDYRLTIGDDQREGGHWRRQDSKWTLIAGSGRLG